MNEPDFLESHTFESFVVGACNQFVHKFALAVAQNPGKSFNPLLIYGGVGMGKTHLLHAIGQDVIANLKMVRVIYRSSKQFIRELTDAIGNNTIIAFRKRYALADVLLIDDIQFFADDEPSQHELFHTFNSLINAHKQIILSSDRPPDAIKNIERQLACRFGWGLSVELRPPDLETRLAILRKKAELLRVKLHPDLFQCLAECIRTNAWRLEGSLMCIAAYHSLHGRELTLDEVKNLLDGIFPEMRHSSRTSSLIGPAG